MPYLIYFKSSLKKGQLLVSFCVPVASLLMEAASRLVTADVMLTTLAARRFAHRNESSSICSMICRLMGCILARICVLALHSLPGALLMMTADDVAHSSGAECWGLTHGNNSSRSCSLLCTRARCS